MSTTRGLKALRSMMEQQGMSQAALAEKLSISQPSVSAWMRGHTRPDHVLRAAIELLFAIPSDWWRTEEERQQLASIITTSLSPTGTDGE